MKDGKKGLWGVKRPIDLYSPSANLLDWRFVIGGLWLVDCRLWRMGKRKKGERLVESQVEATPDKQHRRCSAVCGIEILSPSLLVSERRHLGESVRF